MNKKQFDSQFITEIQGRKVLIFDENYYRKNNIFVPIQYFSTVQVDFLGKPKVDKIRSSQQGSRHIDTLGREIIQNAEVRQETSRNYAVARIDDSPFFSNETKEKVDRRNHSTRMAFPAVEAGMTREMMQAIIDSYEDPRIVEILSDIPIVNLRQLSAIEAGLTDIETIMDGVPRVLDVNGQNAVDDEGRAIELDQADFDAGDTIERRGGQRLRYPVGATHPETGELIEGQPIFREVRPGVIKEQFRVTVLDVENNFQDFDFRERAVSPLASPLQSRRQSFAELSNHARFVPTADTQSHGEPSDGTGANMSTAERRRQGLVTNAFDGIKTSTTTTAGRTSIGLAKSIDPTSEPVQPGVAVGGENPEAGENVDQQGRVPRHQQGNQLNSPNEGNPNETPNKP
jgi:hypothetical protein